MFASVIRRLALTALPLLLLMIVAGCRNPGHPHHSACMGCGFMEHQEPPMTAPAPQLQSAPPPPPQSAPAPITERPAHVHS